MDWHRCILGFVWLAALTCGADIAVAQRLRIVVGGPNFRPYPAAVPKLVTDGASNKATRELVKSLTRRLRKGVDLARSLELVAPRTYLAPDGEPWTQPNYTNWANAGASGLIRGAVAASASQAKVTLRFYDVIGQREAMLRTCEKPRARADECVDSFLDEVVSTLTGDAGVFSSRLAYVRRTPKGKAIFVSDVYGGNVKRVSEPDVLSLLPAWGKAGRHLLFTSYLKTNPDLYRLNLDDGKLQWLSNKRGLNTGASVSPDGSRIALTLSIDGNTEIYVMDWDGENLRRLTDSWGQDVSPTWSPDGSRIAFVSSRSGNPHLYVMNADGSEPRRLTFQGNYNQEPDWSPRLDGEIAFTARDERLKFDIFLVHPDTGEITRLTQDQGNNESPSHSPDGHHIVFTSTREPGAGKQIYLMDVDGRNQRRVSRSGASHETPAWGPRMGHE